MVKRMPTDLANRPRVAWLVAITCTSALGAMGAMGAMAGCGPVVRPNDPVDPNPAVARPRLAHAGASGAQVIVGEICPQGAGGRPAIAPIAMHEVGWSDAELDLDNAIERGSVQRFGVYGVDGKLAGAFDTLGLADIAPGVAVASGTYVGGPPCSSGGGAGGQRMPEPACGPIATGCGLAVGILGRPDNPPESPVLATGGACLQGGDSLAVDIDGDGSMELFPLASLLDGARGPAQEWTAAPVVGASCTPSFTLFGVALTPEAQLSVMGVLDLDGDGRVEVVVALQFPTVRTIAIYTATGSPQRLELAGEGEAFAR